MGECGMTEVQAAKTTMPEYLALADAHAKRMQTSWEQIRWIEWHQTILSPNIKQANKPRTPQDLVRFPWEKETRSEAEKPQTLTAEEIRELNRIFNTTSCQR